MKIWLIDQLLTKRMPSMDGVAILSEWQDNDERTTTSVKGRGHFIASEGWCLVSCRHILADLFSHVCPLMCLFALQISILFPAEMVLVCLFCEVNRWCAQGGLLIMLPHVAVFVFGVSWCIALRALWRNANVFMSWSNNLYLLTVAILLGSDSRLVCRAARAKCSFPFLCNPNERPHNQPINFSVWSL